MYTLLINRSAERDLRRLRGVIFERVNKKILALRDDSRPPGVRKRPPTAARKVFPGRTRMRQPLHVPGAYLPS